LSLLILLGGADSSPLFFSALRRLVTIQIIQIFPRQPYLAARGNSERVAEFSTNHLSCRLPCEMAQFYVPLIRFPTFFKNKSLLAHPFVKLLFPRSIKSFDFTNSRTKISPALMLASFDATIYWSF